MRLCVMVVASLLASSASAMTELDDDPKCARGECRSRRASSFDEDDPKLARGFVVPRPTARFEIGYRFLLVADPFGGSLPFHLAELDAFPISGIARLGVSLTAGGATRYDAYMVDVGLSVGVQYPARVTPFLDARFAAGIIGANILDHSIVSYEYRPGIEGGVEIYFAGRYHLTAAVGYAHPIYGGVDANAVQNMINAGQKPVYDVQSFGYDTVTVRASLGL